MVFKPFTRIAHQGFKGITHGYAQTVVAASQQSHGAAANSFGSFGSNAITRFGKTGPTSHLQNAFQHASNQAGPGAKTGHSGTNTGGNDGGLAAYYAAWQQQQNNGDEQEWKQFQFAKRIGWTPGQKDAKGKEKDLDYHGRRIPVDRTYSASAADDLKKNVDAAAEAEALAKVDEAIAQEMEDANQNGVATGNDKAATGSSGREESMGSDDTAPTSVTMEDLSASEEYAQQLTRLSSTQRYSEIPAAFEAMLNAGVKPTATAYNALLEAAIHLPAAKHQVIPKALDVYADMLRRDVQPDLTTYSTLIQLLACRANDVTAMKTRLEQVRARFGGMHDPDQFMFRSNEAEYDLLAEDNALDVAIKLFRAATGTQLDQQFSPEVYRDLITACAAQARVDDMIHIYAHMELSKAIPYAAIFGPMIEAFAASGDLNSAVECYNEYKNLAIADDKGTFGIIDRRDNDVYAALVKAYVLCGKRDGAMRFFTKIYDSYDGVTTDRDVRLETMQDIVVIEALVQQSLDKRDYTEAMKWVQERPVSSGARTNALAQVCCTAADNNDGEIAMEAYKTLSSAKLDVAEPVIALLAYHIRQGNVSAAKEFWGVLTSSHDVTSAFVEPTAMYSVALMGSGFVEEGIMQARQMFARIRNSINAPKARLDVTEDIDEAIDFIGRFLVKSAIVPAPNAALTLLWMMVENGGLVSPLAEHALAGLGPEAMAQLSWKDLELALQVQSGMVINGSTVLDVAHSTRFSHLANAAITAGLPMDKRTLQMVEQILRTMGSQFPELAQKWEGFKRTVARSSYGSNFKPRSGFSSTPAAFEDTFDPYANTTDYKGSASIADELEKNIGRSDAHLSEALSRFRNMRRVGRHPRYITYAKLIGAAAKEGRMDLVHDILGMARQDMPLLPQYQVVKHGWISILDAMVGACLTLGDRPQAGRFHQELLDMGAAPTANTFGLYITTLKESTKTYDEATEAVKIFHRAMSEGVEPSSFLYNALIGKLGKARRIDDCLFYFAEMRSLGIRPTSVTYGTIVNALCRVSDDKFAEELFEEMESMPNYKPRPAPYNSLMQFFLTTKRDRAKVLTYYERMKSKNIQPTMHTYKLLIDTYATLEPIDMAAAESVLATIKSTGHHPEAVHYASLVHAKGCVLHDMEGARSFFNAALGNGRINIQPCLYQALFEAMVANHRVTDTPPLLQDMSRRGIKMTPYIANTLIHGWAMVKDIVKARAMYDMVGKEKREPSTYEAMTRAYLAVEDRETASHVVQEMLSRGYPPAVAGKVVELIGGGSTYSASHAPSESEAASSA
ncbi:MAG: hypothetical protein M1834_005908 [Cirrosporium novae-zelandiae]|nr:MAG: hypothetical protein M1834_005908 [Cirrosporium novae-zelandiae]